MTTLDASQSLIAFNMGDSTTIGFDAYLTSNSTAYHWQTAFNGTDPVNYVHAFGTGITVDGSGNPTGGTITSLQVDMEQDAVIDVQITDTSVSLVTLLTPTNANPTHADQFWETLLSGDDTILAPDIGGSVMFGDFLDIHSSQSVIEEKIGGDDTISANPTHDASISLRGIGAGPSLIGDALSVSGEAVGDIAYFGALTGGDDKITLTGAPAYSLVGDVYFVAELGIVYGGKDTIRSDAHTDSFNQPFGLGDALVGDVFSNSGDVTGGADNIIGSNYAFLDEFIAGDVRSETGSSTGGRDTIHGRAGHDFIAGDTALSGGFVAGGADRLYGGEDADIISGDVLQAGNDGSFGLVQSGGASLRVTIVGGNDTIHGDQGNDILAGDIETFGRVTGDSEISGGNDKLYGGDGDDTLYGDFGDVTGFFSADFFDNGGKDTLDGGAGNDTQYGGAGNDIFIVARASDSVNERIDGGDGTDRIRFISTIAGETLVLSNQVTRMEIVEIVKANGTTALNINASAVGAGLEIKGNAGANALTGTGFADTITGGGGKDVIAGSAGDRFVYGPASDSTSTGYDTVNKADFSAVIWDVQGPIEAIDAKIATGALSAGNFDTQLANAADAAHLGAHHAVIFTPTSGGLAGTTFLIVDQNNTAGYQAGADLVIQLTNAQHLAGIDVGDFV